MWMQTFDRQLRGHRQSGQGIGITDEVEFYKDSDGIMAMGIMSTPALVIDNKIYAMGRVLTVEQAKEL
jgi:hypothetical protein